MMDSERSVNSVSWQCHDEKGPTNSDMMDSEGLYNDLSYHDPTPYIITNNTAKNTK